MMFEEQSRARIVGLIYRQLVLYWRHVDRKFEVFFWPAVDGILFGSIGTYASSSGSSHTLVLMLVGFVMAQVIWQSHIHLSKFFLQETWDLNVLYLMTRPLRVVDVIWAGVVVATLVATIASMFIAVVMSLVFGIAADTIPFGAVALIPVLMVLGWSTGLLATSLVVVLGHKADEFVYAMFGLIGPLSGSIVPVSALPIIVRPLAYALPTTYAYEAGRSIVFGHTFPWASYITAAVGAVIALGVAMLTLNKAFAKFREKGLVSRYI